MSPFDRAHMISYSFLIETMRLSSTVFQIRRVICRNSPTLVVAAWLTLHNNHFFTIIIDSEAFTDNSFYNKEAISAITMKFSAISPYFHHSSQHSCLCCITYVMHIILSRMRPGPGDLLICY